MDTSDTSAVKPGRVYIQSKNLAICLVCVAFFSACAYFSHKQKASLLVSAAFLFFVAAGFVGIWVWGCTRIRYDQTGFSAWTTFGTCCYADITGLRRVGHDMILFAGQRRILLDKEAIGRAEFLSTARQQYQNAHNGADIPEIPPSRIDPFRGHVSTPGLILAIYAMFFCVLLNIFLSDCLATPKTAAELTYNTLVVERYAFQDDDLLLYVDGDRIPYRIRYYDDALPDPDSFLDACDRGDAFIVGYARYYGSHGPASANVYELRGADGAVYLTLNQGNAPYLNAQRIHRLFSGAVCVLWLGYVALAICVGRDPIRWKKFVRFFFRDRYIRC